MVSLMILTLSVPDVTRGIGLERFKNCADTCMNFVLYQKTQFNQVHFYYKFFIQVVLSKKLLPIMSGRD